MIESLYQQKLICPVTPAPLDNDWTFKQHWDKCAADQIQFISSSPYLCCWESPLILDEEDGGAGLQLHLQGEGSQAGHLERIVHPKLASQAVTTYYHNNLWSQVINTSYSYEISTQDINTSYEHTLLPQASIKLNTISFHSNNWTTYNKTVATNTVLLGDPV